MSPGPATHIAVVPLSCVDDRAERALDYAARLAPRVLALHVRDRRRRDGVEAAWATLAPGVPLVVLDAAARDRQGALRRALDILRRSEQVDLITVVIPPREVPGHGLVPAWAGALRGPGIAVTLTPD